LTCHWNASKACPTLEEFDQYADKFPNQGMREGMDRDIGDTDRWMTRDVVTGYQTSDPQRELYQHMERKFAPMLAKDDVINCCGQPPCHARGSDADKRTADAGMRRTNSAFWETADWFQDEYLREKPVNAGLFDLNRYQNR
jgi:hypothetical protein